MSGVLVVECVAPAGAYPSSGPYSIRGSGTVDDYLMVDLSGCTTGQVGTACGRLTTSSPGDLQVAGQTPARFGYDLGQGTLEYLYEGSDERLVGGRYCLIALRSDGGPSGVSDAGQAQVVRTTESSCRDFPNTRRFHLQADPTVNAVDIVVSTSSSAPSPLLLVREAGGPVGVGAPEAGDDITRWRLEATAS